MSQETVERAFAVPQPAKLKLSNVRGSVQVRAGAADQILISAVKHTESGDASRTEILMEQAEDGSVKVETRFSRSLLSFLGAFPCKVDYIVQVPENSILNISGVSNSVAIRGLEGEFKITTVSGPVELRELFGPIRVNTVSGSVDGEQVSGKLDYDSVSGRIVLKNSRVSEVHGTSVSGSARIETNVEEGPYRFNSVSGAVTLTVPADTCCTAEISSVSGRIKTVLPITRQSKQNGKGITELGGGGTRIFLSSVSGNLNVTTGEEMTEEMQGSATAETGPDSQHTQEILDKIERGEISVEEGIALLKKT